MASFDPIDKSRSSGKINGPVSSFYVYIHDANILLTNELAIQLLTLFPSPPLSLPLSITITPMVMSKVPNLYIYTADLTYLDGS